MKAIAFINRFLMIGVTLIFIAGLTGNDDATLVGLLLGIPLGAFQVIASLILISYRAQMTEGLKWSLNAYYFFVVFYFLLFNATINDSSSEEILITIPVLLAIGITIVVELMYKEIKKSYEN